MADIIRSLQDGVYRDFSDAKARTDLASEFSASDSYDVGDLVMYDGYLYKFTDTHSAGDWVGTDAVQVTVGDELSSLDAKEENALTSINALESSIAIVANGNTHSAVSAGQYVYLKSHDTLSEGLYVANSAIGANVALTTSNLARVSNGGLNNLNLVPVDVSYTLTSGSGLTNLGMAVLKYGKIVWLQAAFSLPANSNARNVEVLTLSAKPKKQVSVNYIGDAGSTGYYDIYTDGRFVIYLRAGLTAQVLRLCVTYICQ